jgi:hypothetical protein
MSSNPATRASSPRQARRQSHLIAFSAAQVDGARCTTSQAGSQPRSRSTPSPSWPIAVSVSTGSAPSLVFTTAYRRSSMRSSPPIACCYPAFRNCVSLQRSAWASSRCWQFCGWFSSRCGGLARTSDGYQSATAARDRTGGSSPGPRLRWRARRSGMANDRETPNE